jgi:hypothetical protein
MTRPGDVMNWFTVVAADVTSQLHPSFIELDLKYSLFNKEAHHETRSSSSYSRFLHRRYHLCVVSTWCIEER